MRRFVLAAALCASLAAGACASHSLAAPAQALVIAKAEYGFEAAYNVAAHAYLARIKAGPWDATRKAAAKGALVKTYAAVLAARKAQAVGDAQGLADQIAAVNALVAQVKGLTS